MGLRAAIYFASNPAFSIADITPVDTPVSRAISLAPRAGAVSRKARIRARWGVSFTTSDKGVSGRVKTGCSGGGTRASGVFSISRMTEPNGANVQRQTCSRNCKFGWLRGGTSASIVTAFNFDKSTVLVAETSIIMPQTWRVPSGIFTIVPTGA